MNQHAVTTCEDNPLWGENNIEIPQNFASQWCGTEGYWKCGVSTLPAADPRNTAQEDYKCDCDGATKNCPKIGNDVVVQTV